MLLNRFLILMPDSKAKSPVILLVFLVAIGGAAAVGFALPRFPWIYAPVLVLCLLMAGELRRPSSGVPALEANRLTQRRMR